MTETAKLLKAVHTCRRQVQGLADDATWRDFLGKHAGGQTSTRAMTGRQLTRVLKALHAAGAPAVTPPRRARTTTRLAADDQDRKIRSLWLELWEAGVVDDPGEPALLAFVKARAGAERLEWVGAAAKVTLIEQLKGWLSRSDRDPVCPVRLSVRDPATGRADPARFCGALWKALREAGAFEEPIFANEGRWLMRRYSVQAWHFLTEDQARDAAGELCTWLRRVVKAKQGGDGDGD